MTMAIVSKYFEVMTSSLPLRSLGSAASLLAASRYQGNHERKHNLLKILWCQVLRDIVLPSTV